MTYEESLAYIANLELRGWRLGLDRMQAFVNRAGLTGSLGEPGGPQFVHVAGTNGKGSVTDYLQCMLSEAGFRTGAFFSPFVVDPRERVQLNRTPISREDLARIVTDLAPIADSFSETEFGGISEFEFKTAVGFEYWKRQRAEWVALEVGLGGRLDATTVVHPRSTAIVSIGLDHVSILGHTRAEIAREKAGIAKGGVPLVLGEMADEAAVEAELIAGEVGAPVLRVGSDIRYQLCEDGLSVETPWGKFDRLHPGLLGSKQPHNAAVAVGALLASGVQVDEPAIRGGLAAASAPGRFQQIHVDGRLVILDGAHNSDSARALRDTLKARLASWPERLVLLTNMVRGHEPDEFYSPFVGIATSAHVAPIDFRRAMLPQETAARIESLGMRATAHPSARAALDAALQDAGEDGVVVVTGSFYLVGDISRKLGLLGPAG